MKLLGLVIISLMAIALPASTTLEVFALTKEQAASQYAEREKAKQNSGETELVGPALNVITLEISKTCYASLRYNNTTNCPSYDKLVKYDMTNQKYLGKFITKNGMLIRDKPAIKNPSIMLWGLKETLVCVDCPWDVYKNSKHIIITGDPFVYKSNDDRIIKNNTRIEYHNRYVENCAYAKVYWDSWLVNDTINYIKSGCTKTEYNGTKVIYTPPSKLTYDGQWYQHVKFLKEAKKLAQTNCIKSDKC